MSNKDIIKSDFIEKIKILKKHNNLYYNNDKPIISDFEYDRIKNEILGLEKKHNFLRKLNLTNKLFGSAPSNKFKKIEAIIGN